MRAAGYYSNGKRGSLDGARIWRPKWYGELGNDAEFREATKPRTAFKAKYYEGGHRMMIDGTPIRVAAHVKNWKPSNRAALCQGFDRLGLLAGSHSKRDRAWLPDEKRDSMALAGDLFNYGAEYTEKVVCGIVGRALHVFGFDRLDGPRR